MTDSTTADFVIRGTRVATPEGIRPAAVVVRSGAIAAVLAPDEALPALPVHTLAEEEVLLPGLVDSHVHVNEPGRTEWEGFATATRAAAAGGVTTICDMPLNSLPVTTTVEALRIKREAARGQSLVDVRFWGGAVPSNVGTLAKLHEAGVVGFKCFLLDSGIPEFPPLDAALLETAMTEIAAFDGLLIVHAEDADLISSHARTESTYRYSDFLGTRPPESELRAIETVIETARRTGCRAHIVHLSTGGALPMLRAARADGVRITVETCPHYLSLAAEEIADRATQFKCCPPVRDGANADLLWEGLRSGVIDMIVSDHSPATPELKFAGGGDFAVAWGGIAGLEISLPVVWTEARRRGVPLEQVVDWMSAAPARVVGLAGKGAIVPGGAADLVVFAPEESFTVEAAALHHRHPVSAYQGQHLYGRVDQTYLAGQLLRP